MDLQHHFDAAGDTAVWEAALHPPEQTKYDNRAYLVAAFGGWSESANGPITAPQSSARPQSPEEQPVPVAYAGGYR